MFDALSFGATFLLLVVTSAGSTRERERKTEIPDEEENYCDIFEGGVRGELELGGEADVVE